MEDWPVVPLEYHLQHDPSMHVEAWGMVQAGFQPHLHRLAEQPGLDNEAAGALEHEYLKADVCDVERNALPSGAHLAAALSVEWC